MVNGINRVALAYQYRSKPSGSFFQNSPIGQNSVQNDCTLSPVYPRVNAYRVCILPASVTRNAVNMDPPIIPIVLIPLIPEISWYPIEKLIVRVRAKIVASIRLKVYTRSIPDNRV